MPLSEIRCVRCGAAIALPSNPECARLTESKDSKATVIVQCPACKANNVVTLSK